MMIPQPPGPSAIVSIARVSLEMIGVVAIISAIWFALGVL